jgi:hypothetical protein
LDIGDFEVSVNGIFQFSSTAVHSTPELLFGKGGEPAFYKVKPRRSCGSEMYMVARMTRKPAVYQGCFMRGLVIHNNMDLKNGWSGCINLIEKLAKLYGTVLLMTLT